MLVSFSPHYCYIILHANRIYNFIQPFYYIILYRQIFAKVIKYLAHMPNSFRPIEFHLKSLIAKYQQGNSRPE